ncbi:hypothetical protein QAD02_018706 [Eretmocerus hayati]|uniref:Uncharacterized protein n=1 Tax=Eretmocerus hayati TaxID=131215 RepID=A0ACC2PH48_9HYME|nr:hypothetical protein QAD02_018706 [Eretmocerus hayati]
MGRNRNCDSDNSASQDDPLRMEKAWIARTIMQLELYQGYPEGVNRQKNASDSILYRMKGNELFKSKSHNREIHLKTLERYSQSIALAPNNSEELAMAYGNRSALTHHLKQYKECLEDCDRAIKITKSEVLKNKLTCRKLECLAAMGDKSLESECDIALNSLKTLSLDVKIKDNFVEKINNIKNNTLPDPIVPDSSKYGKKSKKSKKPSSPSELFQHQDEIPCASEAVTIEYNKRWGRHIVATRDINPGEIVAVEKHFFQFVYPECMYWCCSYCTKFSWSSIPCQGCIYGIYCSEKCRSAAWVEFHRFECKIFPLVWDIDRDLKSATQTIRFFLSVVHQAGGLAPLKQEFMRVQKNEDPRTQGFSDDGVFRSDCRSILGLKDYSHEASEELQSSSGFNATVALYRLIRETDFFGFQLRNSLLELIPQNEDILFAGAIFLRLSYLPPRYGSQLLLNTDELKEFTGLYLSPFCGLFNHSCDPNVRFIRSRNNETIVYAKHPIKRGEQLFCSYTGDYMHMPKELRLAQLDIYNFECQCLACKKNWTSASMPYIEDLLRKNLRVNQALIERIQALSKTSFKDMFCVRGKFKPEFLEKVKAIQKELAEKVTVHCHEYEGFDSYIHLLYMRTFGPWFEVPEIC